MTSRYDSGKRRERSWEREDRDRDRREKDRRKSRSRSPRRDRRPPGRERDYDRRDRDTDDRRDRDRGDHKRDRDRDADRRRFYDRDKDRRRSPPPPRRDDRAHDASKKSLPDDKRPEKSIPPLRASSSGRMNLNPDSQSPEPGEEIEDAQEGAGADDDEAAMMAMMGMSGFGSTKGKHVEGNQEGAVDVKKMRTWRQYMNRRGGFNRPLDKIK